MAYCLEENLDCSRTNEMSRWGRTHSYPIMRDLLKNKRGTILDLVNHGLAMVDDELDSSADPLGRLRYFQAIFQQSYSGKIIRASTQAQQAIADLGYALNELSREHVLQFTDRTIGKHTYEEVLNFWKIEEQNLQRRWKILDEATLDEITMGIGSLVASQFLYILDSPRVFNEFKQLVRAYGLAVKLADNLSDFRDDIRKGFVNISQENIHHVSGISVKDGRLTQINPEMLALSTGYMMNEYRRIEQAFASADRLMLFARARRPIWDGRLDEILCVFGQFCHSWLDQAREVVCAETKH
ncbi:MAG: hypothetical protein V1866_02610 [archaeon]